MGTSFKFAKKRSTFELSELSSFELSSLQPCNYSEVHRFDIRNGLSTLYSINVCALGTLRIRLKVAKGGGEACEKGLFFAQL